MLGQTKNCLRTIVFSVVASGLAITLFNHTASAQPSWCDRSNLNDAEVAICDTPSLREADNALETAYRLALSDEPRPGIPRKPTEIRNRQKAWLLWRDACGYNVHCLRKRYDEQIGWLEEEFYD